MVFRVDYGKGFIILLRWILILVVGSILYFSYPPGRQWSPTLLFILLYGATNVLLHFLPERRFQRPLVLFLILVVDVILTSIGLYLAVGGDSSFYLVFFLILLVAAASRRAYLLYAALGLILTVYGTALYVKDPVAFGAANNLLRFPFLLVVTFFFHGMIGSYNRMVQEKEILAEDNRELEALTEVARSIAETGNLPKFLLTMTKILTTKLDLKRCTAVYVDHEEGTGCMVSSNDKADAPPLWLDLKKMPALKESLKREQPPEGEDLSGDLSRYSIKTIPIVFRHRPLGTLYLRASTPKPRLTHREEFFLERLAAITAMAVHNFGMERPLILQEVSF
jgi:K+-sensing histidine kinase KdpD